MSAHLANASRLLERGRYSEAEDALRRHLAAEPECVIGHAMLAITLANRDELDAAEHEAREAVRHGPDAGTAYYALAVVMLRRAHFRDAEDAAREAVRLDPQDPEYHHMLGETRFAQSRYEPALAAADEALVLEPEHTDSLGLRVRCLVQLGRADEADAATHHVLARAPESSEAHANRGWTLLNQRKHQEAMLAYREALRLDPENEWARAGILEALKARNPVYGWMLRYFLWMNKLSGAARWGVVIGGYIAFRMLRSVANQNPALAPWIWPILGVYLAFVLLTWIAVPLFNLLLRLHPIGRHALSRDQRAGANLVGALILIALGSGIAAFVWPGVPLVLLALLALLLMLPAASIHLCDRGWPRSTMAAITLGLAVVGALWIVLHAGTPATGPNASPAVRALGAVFLIGVFASLWIANWLTSVTPKR